MTEDALALASTVRRPSDRRRTAVYNKIGEHYRVFCMDLHAHHKQIYVNLLYTNVKHILRLITRGCTEVR